MKWEYIVGVIGDLGNAAAVMNGYGDQGWELISVVPLEMPVHAGGRDIALVFKRPKAEVVYPSGSQGVMAGGDR